MISTYITVMIRNKFFKLIYFIEIIVYNTALERKQEIEGDHMASKLTFKGGIHPLRSIHHGKFLSEKRPIEACSVPEEVILPLSQHIGAPSVPVVKAGDKVDMGQMVGNLMV
jgi:hypothetical protein